MNSNEFKPNLEFYKKEFGRLNLSMFDDEFKNEVEEEQERRGFENTDKAYTLKTITGTFLNKIKSKDF